MNANFSAAEDVSNSAQRLAREIGRVKALLQKRIERTDGGCLLWQGAVGQKGYGRIQFMGKPRQANRLAYEIFIGSIPVGLWVLHRCDTPRCVNPSHLFLGTCQDNNRDKSDKGRQSRGEGRPLAKLSDAKVREIRSSQLPISELARKFGVHRGTVRCVVEGSTWTHVKEQA